MACCLICFRDSPVDDSPLSVYYTNPDLFQVGMNKSCCRNPCACLFGSLCGPLSQCLIRRRLLEKDMTRYECCQNYFGGCLCCRPGHMGEKTCPTLCLCLESCCCLSCALSANRMYIMDKYRLQPDKWDNRIIRFNNFVQLLSCVCHCLALFDERLKDLSRCLECCGQIVFCCTSGCMTAQMDTELNYQESLAGPKAQVLDRESELLQPVMGTRQQALQQPAPPSAV